MSGLAKLVFKLGDRPIAVLSIVLSLLAVLAGLFWLNQQAVNQQQEYEIAKHQQVAAMIHAGIEGQVKAVNKHMVSLAKMPQLALLLMGKNDTLIASQQHLLQQTIPNAKKVCLIAAHVDRPEPTACMAISFATLHSLRQAKKEGSGPMALMQLASGDPYLLLTQRVVDSAEHVVGVLVVTLESDFMHALLLPQFGLDGYVELQQGTKKSIKLLSQGDSQWKQGPAFYQKAIANSHWTLAYWPSKSASSNLFLPVSGGVLVFIILMWLLREFCQRSMMQHDVAVLQQQLTDLQDHTLKTSYPLAYRALQPLVDRVQNLGKTLLTLSRDKAKVASQPEHAVIPERTVETSEVTEPELELEQLSMPTATIFKAYDIRGIVGSELTEQVVNIIGQAIGSQALDQNQTRLVVGRDGRLSSESLSSALIDGILASGCDVIDIGQVPTPIAYYAYEHLGSHSGVVVTGSHNPANYNGLKIVIEGKPIFGATLQKLYQRILEGNLHKGQGNKQSIDVVDDYIAKIVADIELTRSVKVVIDCGNGVAGPATSKLLSALGCEVTELYCDVDGNFPNHHPNPSEPENLQDLMAAVQEHEAELGLAFDGDGDRLVAVDTKGQIIWPDRLMIMFAQDILSRLPGSTIIYDVKCSRLLEDAILRSGGEAIMWQSGHSVIKSKMLETDAQLAGEMSGHIFFKDRWFGFDDALYSACRLLELLVRDPLERTPTEVFAALPNRENTPEILVEMAEGESQRFMRQLVAEASFQGAKITTIDGLRADFPAGWGLVRASNTLPGLTLRFEADSVDNLHDIQQQFKQQMLQVKPTLVLHF